MSAIPDRPKAADRRRLKRSHLIYYLRVFNRLNGQVVGHLVDITAEGAMLIHDAAMPTGQRYELRMMLPADIFGRDHLDFDAESLWSKRDTNPDFYDTGFRLLNVEARDADVISRLIDEYGFRD